MKPYLIQHLLEESFYKSRAKPCIMDKAGSLTYEEVLVRAKKIAYLLKELNVKEGEHVALFLDKSINLILSLLGVLYADAVFVVINPILKREQIAHILYDCRIKCIIFSHKRVSESLLAFCKEMVEGAFIFDGVEEFGFQNEFLFNGDFSSCHPGDVVCNRISDDTSHIIYTSGSTGLPKGIVLSHRNTIDGAKIVSSYTKLNCDDKIIGALPLNFDYGLNQLINTFYMGATLFLYDFFTPNDLLKTIEREEITVFAGMTPIWSKIFNPKLTNLSKPFNFSKLRIVTNTGGKVPVQTVCKLKELFSNAQIYLMYGLTEAFRSTFLDPDEIDKRPESIGKAVPNVKVFVVNSKSQECKPHEEGELVHSGALITKGYWNNREKTKEVFRPSPFLDAGNKHLETVVYSGDIVKKDEEGFIYYVGRKDQMIKTKGYRVSPGEVEELLLGIKGVSDCIATGFEIESEICLRVFVTLSDQSMGKTNILVYCRQNFPFYLVPDDVVICSTFPLTANGKVDRNKVIGGVVNN